ncbi:VWA domain-containing protein [Candidatus Babeliales bacterium]|nr:VWA domain-containing protein [Candidatus Babeliales bacterium]
MDTRSKVDVNGVDIVLALDVSGSMEIFDDPHDRRPRIQVAKEEAINFINKRPNDPIGLVVFAVDTLSLAPPTLDKSLLQESIEALEIGFVNPNGTALAQGLATAVSRLRNSKSKSKIVILLTDGQPTGRSKVSIKQAIKLAKQYKIKVYTMGIGNENGGYFQQFGRIIPAAGLGQDTGVDKKLLTHIAQETGGKFFAAHNPQEIRDVYNTIDQLEKTNRKADVFSRYYEAFWLFAAPLLVLLCLESLLRCWLWKGLAW